MIKIKKTDLICISVYDKIIAYGNSIMEVFLMHVIDWFILVISLFLIVIVMMQNSKDDINDAFSGSKTDLFKNQKTRGIDLVLERATLVLAVAFFVLIIIAACIYM